MPEAIRDLRQLGDATNSPPVAAKDRPHYKDEKAMPIRLDRLVAFIYWYQRNHNGNTPTARVMANEMSATEEAINFWLRRLEENGKITMSRAPLRIILLLTAKDLEAARRLDDALRGSRFGWEPTPQERRANYEALDSKRIQLAHFIGEVNEKTGKGPNFREMMDFCVTGNGNLVQAMIDNLVERNIVANPGTPRSIHLTENGKMITGMTKEAPATAHPERIGKGKLQWQSREEKMQALALATEARKAKTDARDRVAYDKALAFAGEHGRGPTASELGRLMGTTSVGNIHRLVERLIASGKVRRTGKGKPLELAVAYPWPPAKAPDVPAKAPDGRAHNKVDIANAVRLAGTEQKYDAVYHWMVDYVRKTGKAPLLQEIADQFGYSHGRSARVAVDALVERGLVKRTPRIHRGLTVLDGPNGNPVTKAAEHVPFKPRGPVADENRKRWPRRVGSVKMAVFIADYWAKYGDAPNYAEMSAATQSGKSASVAHLLDYMEEHGWIERKPKHHRSVKLTERGAAIVAEARGEKVADDFCAVEPGAPVCEVEEATMHEIRETAPTRSDYLPEPGVRDVLGRSKWAGSGLSEVLASSEEARRPEPATIKDFDTADLVLELIERGYTVRRN